MVLWTALLLLYKFIERLFIIYLYLICVCMYVCMDGYFKYIWG